MKNPQTIAFIGAGNMARGLIGGLINDGYDPSLIWATTPDQESLDALSNQFKINITTDNKKAANMADVVILSVKPDVIRTVCVELADIINKKSSLIVSIAAGIRTSALIRWLGDQVPIVRCMPNLCALVGSGATGLYATEKVNETQKEIAESILRAVGIALWVDDESDLDVITALSGSGPAYFFYIMEALEHGGIDLGLSKETAHLLAIQTALGAAKIALESQEELAKLRQQVTSPGGTTERALNVFEEGRLRETLIKGMEAAKSRAEELAKTFE